MINKEYKRLNKEIIETKRVLDNYVSKMKHYKNNSKLLEGWFRNKTKIDKLSKKMEQVREDTKFNLERVK